MMKLILLFIISLNLFASDTEERRKKILTIINEEISEVEELNEQTGHSNPEFLVRVAELYMEKGRLVKEAENKKYLSLSIEQRQKAVKDNYFKQSSALFKKATAQCERVIQKFPRYSGIGEVYYILGHNAKESRDDKKAQEYLARAQKSRASSSSTNYKAQVSLAEIYYNSGKYREAIPLYESSLAKEKGMWWTKDSFNLAWSYYKTNQHSKAIEKMLVVYKTSENKDFVDMKSSVERDIGIFYADAGRVDDAINFYKKKNIDYSAQLLRIAEFLKSQGKFTKAEQVLAEAQRVEKNDKKKAQILMGKLELYEKYSKNDEHLKTCEQLLPLVNAKKLSTDEIKRYVYHVEKAAAILQKQVAGDTYSHVPQTQRIKAAQAVRYFAIKEKIDTSNPEDHIFMQGETHYAAKNYKEALNEYIRAYEVAKKSKNKKIKDLSLDGSLSCLAQPSLPETVKENYYIPVYINYLAEDKASEKAKSIHEKLFNAYSKKNDYKNAELVMASLSRNFPNDYQMQEAMHARVMDHYKNKKDKTKVKALIVDINKGKYKISKKYATKLKELLTSMQMESAQDNLNSGKKKEALIGYLNVLKDTEATAKAKTNSRYNLAILYFELGDNKESSKYVSQSLNEMEDAEIKDFYDTFIGLIKMYFAAGDINLAAVISEKLGNKVCQLNVPKKELTFRNSTLLYLAEDKIENAERSIAAAKQCQISKAEIFNLQFELLKSYKENNLWEQYESLTNELAAHKENEYSMIPQLYDLEKIHLENGNSERSKGYQDQKLNIYLKARKNKVSLNRESFDLMYEYELKQLNLLVDQYISSPLTVKEFKKQFQLKANALTRIIDEAKKASESGSAIAAVEAFAVVIKSLNIGIDQIKNLKTEDGNKEVQDSLDKIKPELIQPLEQVKNEQIIAMKNTIHQNDILYLGQLNYIIPKIVQPLSFEARKSVIMDKGGKR
jgi:hypothetical protein